MTEAEQKAEPASPQANSNDYDSYAPHVVEANGGYPMSDPIPASEPLDLAELRSDLKKAIGASGYSQIAFWAVQYGAKILNCLERAEAREKVKTEALHAALSALAPFADPGRLNFGPINVFACHETDDAHCVGWLVNQLGPGNNIGLRIQMISCVNAKTIRLRGEQHESFEDTLP